VKISIQLDGMQNLERIAARGQKAQRILSRAMYSEANTVLNQSKKIVPVDLGTLKNSGKVKKPVFKGSTIDVDITYGGAAADYAFIVHEDPNARHAPGKTYKYLEMPFMAHKPTFERNMRVKFIAWMLGGP